MIYRVDIFNALVLPNAPLDLRNRSIVWKLLDYYALHHAHRIDERAFELF